MISHWKGKALTSRELPQSTATRHSTVIWKSTEAPITTGDIFADGQNSNHHSH